MVKSTKITKGWPPKRKKEYAARIRKTKIWLNSTGPRTAQGKVIANQNARKHGAYSAPWKELRAALRGAHRQFLQRLRMDLKKIKVLEQISTSSSIPRPPENFRRSRSGQSHSGSRNQSENYRAHP